MATEWSDIETLAEQSPFQVTAIDTQTGTGKNRDGSQAGRTFTTITLKG